jgi:hypothetical protein
MGDTLKDACEVMGVADCLTKVLNAIKLWQSNTPAWRRRQRSPTGSLWRRRFSP